MTALSGLDQALWDIAGKSYGVPVYKLLGGAARDRIRVYAHWGIRDLSDEGLAAARERLDFAAQSSAATPRSNPARRASGAGTSRRPSSTASSSAPT